MDDRELSSRLSEIENSLKEIRELLQSEVEQQAGEEEETEEEDDTPKPKVKARVKNG